MSLLLTLTISSRVTVYRHYSTVLGLKKHCRPAGWGVQTKKVRFLFRVKGKSASKRELYMVALDDLDSLRGGNSFIHIVLKTPLCMNIYWYLIEILATEFF